MIDNQEQLNVGCKWRYKQARRIKESIKMTVPGGKLYRCDHDNCGKTYKTWLCLQRHRSMHYKAIEIRPYHCDWNECAAKFSKLKCLIVHRRKHTGAKPFKCHYSACNKEFRCSHTLSAHKRKHLDQCKTRPTCLPIVDGQEVTQY